MGKLNAYLESIHGLDEANNTASTDFSNGKLEGSTKEVRKNGTTGGDNDFGNYPTVSSMGFGRGGSVDTDLSSGLFHVYGFIGNITFQDGSRSVLTP